MQYGAHSASASASWPLSMCSRSVVHFYLEPINKKAVDLTGWYFFCVWFKSESLPPAPPPPPPPIPLKALSHWCFIYWGCLHASVKWCHLNPPTTRSCLLSVYEKTTVNVSRAINLSKNNWWLMKLFKKRKESGTRMTASVLNQDRNWEK